MTTLKGYVYLKVNSDLEGECKKAKIFKFTKELEMIKYDGWVWVGESKEWSPKNYTINNAIFRCNSDPAKPSNNTVWFDMTEKKYSSMSDEELEYLALSIIIAEETAKIEAEKRRVLMHEEKIKVLKDNINKLKED